MNNLRQIRIFLAVIFFVAAVAYLFAGPWIHPMAAVAKHVQIIPSALAITMGCTMVWLALTFFAGRLYCSTVCPAGTLQDLGYRLGKALPERMRKRSGLGRTRFRPDRRRGIRNHIFWIYVICIIAGLGGVSSLIEPWNMMRDIAYAFSPTATESGWITLGLGTATGIVAGIATLLLLLLCGLFMGRDFCNTVCPVGTFLGAAAPYALYHIEIDPDKCTSCMRCEEECRAHCIKVVSRYVDNARCVRCFDCIKCCNDNAIRFQHNRNRPATPLFRKRVKAK